MYSSSCFNVKLTKKKKNIEYYLHGMHKDNPVKIPGLLGLFHGISDGIMHSQRSAR
jgi:hypothetical protein